jgi:predicted DNA-binding transcriptional regulator AlpA
MDESRWISVSWIVPVGQGFVERDRDAMRQERRPLGRPDEVADHLGVSVKTLAQWRWQGAGPAWVKVGSHVRYEWDAVDAYIGERTVDRRPVPG